MNFSTIWNTHKRHLLNFINTKIDDTHIAEDILQEVSVKLFENLQSKKNIRNYKNWLFQVSRNTIADYYRKNKKHTGLTTENTEPISEQTTSCVCDLSGFVIKNYLPEKYSTPLYLSDIQQKPQQDIAKELQLSLPATKSRIQRARKQLKKLVLDCIEITYNTKGQITDFQLKKNCELPQELKSEIKLLNIKL